MGRLCIAPSSVFLTFVACLLLILASVSCVSKSVDSISFLNADFSNGTINFGALAYTGSGRHVGYDFPNGVVPNMSPFTGDYFHVLTGFMILHPIAAGFTGVGFIVGTLGLIFRSPIAAGFMTYLSILASSLIFIALCFDLGLWIYVRNQIRHQGIHAELGKAVWFTLSAYIINMLAYILGACAVVEIAN
ncbi:hypothetical protein SCHPADRAFT_934970 [Schizopora paradoxa]|uniref:Pali-domain-containing protein n=1 Tax=Schizopora paradoxa TaxID=27342 RepID=A0A0H2S797_9AGAM|nr:hypothetical protein SCHPADRAFT_934970 [Schizopora paradoxa]